MNIIKKIKMYLNKKGLNKKLLINKQSSKDKLEILLEEVIDKIEIKENSINIKTKNNILIENEGHIVSISSGVNVTMANQIHLNPNINFQDGEFEHLNTRLKKSIEEERKKIKYKETDSCCHK
jgi:hypothetical protein